ncbi:Enzymatic Polyprotein [Phytophthora palmivora]|uniref:Enzymatic Polyprotein n=1 Tax=Phytophthora palmivora TaxID=4796 RepID=A0A2P4XRZ6_9STRA|nr:Enzymatic Polyprotein [Phytophthora palmivora]
MPFGLTNAPATFQRMMNGVLRGLTWTTCLVYLDDVVIFTKGGIERHIIEVASVLARLSSAGLTLKLKKCLFAAESMEYLGHMLDSAGVRPVDRLVEAVAEFPSPTDPTEVKRFDHLAGYYRKFIEAFGSIVAPLTRLLKKNSDWQWTEEQQLAFERVKAILTTRPLLMYPDFARSFRLVTDASKVGLGACLMQDYGRGWKPVAFASKVNSNAESNYSITELECLAVVWSVKLFRPYLYGRSFTIVTDHSALKWLMTRPNLAGRLHRWSLTLQEYDFEIQYRPGSTNVVPDALSRAPAAVRAAVGARKQKKLLAAHSNVLENPTTNELADSTVMADTGSPVAAIATSRDDHTDATGTAATTVAAEISVSNSPELDKTWTPDMSDNVNSRNADEVRYPKQCSDISNERNEGRYGERRGSEKA